MASAFVTGGSGFIGGALVRRLVADGWSVRALARSDAAAQKVRALGAEPAPGDLSDAVAMTAGAGGCELVFHCAAHLGDWGRREDFERANVDGTRNALSAARQAGVRRFVHVGTEAAVLAGQPLVEADERAPLRFDSKALYSATKARAEEAVVEANGDGLETVVVRPRFVWGRGDTTLLPQIVAAARSGRWAWIGGGRHRTSTTHVENVVHGLLLGAERGAPGGVYFVTDGPPVVFREFVSRLLETQGVEAPQRTLPRPLAHALAAGGETAWRVLPLPGRPPLTRFAYWVSAMECTIDISRARSELGYEPVKDMEAGLRELEEAA
ncbi:MAG TPA: NAD-dependent epimerase/dehydratase family protein [Solirubrobacteraceae bacterium]|nr:NAD-dependent epimerase/dehydratase family protein [Solirubrobacteraceae bacterium]